MNPLHFQHFTTYQGWFEWVSVPSNLAAFQSECEAMQAKANTALANEILKSVYVFVVDSSDRWLINDGRPYVRLITRSHEYIMDESNLNKFIAGDRNW